MQFNMAGLRVKARDTKEEKHCIAPGVTADIDHNVPIVLVGIYCVKIKERRSLISDRVSLPCLPDVLGSNCV